MDGLVDLILLLASRELVMGGWMDERVLAILSITLTLVSIDEIGGWVDGWVDGWVNG
jgi:hypothetical protein